MKPWNAVLFAIISIFVACPVVAQQSITFGNLDGAFTGTPGAGGTLDSGDLGLSSTLTSISGFTGDLSGYNTSNNAGLGTLSFSTGALTSGSLVPLTGETSTFGPGGQFTVTDTYNGGYGGFTFSGVFSSSNWSCLTGSTCKKIATGEWTGTWIFSGTLAMGATLTINGQQFTATTPGTIQITTVSQTVTRNANGSVNFMDAGGTTNFGGNFQVSPEPGTLTLFGSGLIAVGMLTKYGRSKKLRGSTSSDS